MIPIVTTLLTNGLSLLANAFLAKGKDYIEEKTGVDLSKSELSEGELLRLKQFQLENEVELRQIQHEDNKLEAELEKARLDADVAFQSSAQATARIEAQSSDEYVRRTRPKLARQSAYVTFAYSILSGIVFPAANALYSVALPGPDEWVIGALFSPCLAYMGVRTLDKWKGRP